jgi:hypothetical protein
VIRRILQLPFDVRVVHVASVGSMVLERSSLNMAVNISLVQIATQILLLLRQKDKRKPGFEELLFKENLASAREADDVQSKPEGSGDRQVSRAVRL